MPPDKIIGVLRQPTTKMEEGGMTAVDLREEEMKALLAYLNSLK